MGDCPPIRSLQSARTASTINVARFGGAPPPQRSLPSIPNSTWECSHLGGDRFAATMLVLPEGLCYGRVDSTDSADLVRLYLEGRLDNRFLRGRTSLPHAVQAAQYFAREAYGDDRIDALHPLDVERREHEIHVMLSGESGPIEVILKEELSEPLLSACQAKVAGQVRIFTLASLTPG